MRIVLAAHRIRTDEFSQESTFSAVREVKYCFYSFLILVLITTCTTTYITSYITSYTCLNSYTTYRTHLPRVNKARLRLEEDVLSLALNSVETTRLSK